MASSNHKLNNMQEIKKVLKQKTTTEIKSNRKIFSPSSFFSKKKKTKRKKEVERKSKTKIKEDHINLSWESREFIKKEKGVNWYLYASITAIILIGFAIITRDLIVGIVFGLIIIIVYLFADKEPDKMNVKIDHKGVHLNDKLYQFEELESFWIFYEPKSKKLLSLISKKVFMPAIKIQLEDQNPVLIRNLLLKYMPEEEQKESTIDILADRLNI